MDGRAGARESVRLEGAGVKEPLLYACPRFGHCSAPACPLWPNSLAGSHRRGDEACAHLMEAAKPQGAERLRGLLPDPLQQGVLAALPSALALGGDLSRRLRRAAQQGSKADAAARARNAKAGRGQHGSA